MRALSRKSESEYCAETAEWKDKARRVSVDPSPFVCSVAALGDFDYGKWLEVKDLCLKSTQRKNRINLDF